MSRDNSRQGLSVHSNTNAWGPTTKPEVFSSKVPWWILMCKCSKKCGPLANFLSLLHDEIISVSQRHVTLIWLIHSSWLGLFLILCWIFKWWKTTVKSWHYNLNSIPIYTKLAIGNKYFIAVMGRLIQPSLKQRYKYKKPQSSWEAKWTTTLIFIKSKNSISFSVQKANPLLMTFKGSSYRQWEWPLSEEWISANPKSTVTFFFGGRGLYTAQRNHHTSARSQNTYNGNSTWNKNIPLGNVSFSLNKKNWQ